MSKTGLVCKMHPYHWEEKTGIQVNIVELSKDTPCGAKGKPRSHSAGGNGKDSRRKLGHWRQRAVQLGERAVSLQERREKQDGKANGSGDTAGCLQY